MISAPLEGRRPAIFAVTGASLLLNVILAAALLWPSAPEVAPVAALEPAAAAPPAEEEAPVEVAAAAPVAKPAGVMLVRGKVDRNLGYTLQQAGAPDADKLAAVTARLFVWDLDLRRDLQRGDEVVVAYAMEDDLPMIHAARYRSNKRGDTLTAYRFQAEGDAYPSYWDAAGREVPHQLVDCPLNGEYEQITSLLKDRPTHKGMDFKAPVGTPVVSPRAGTVVRTDWNWKYNGNSAEIRWADGTLARFLHLSETQVKPGQKLAAGAVIGLSGNTGRSTAPHLHYELEKNGKVIDPAKAHGTRQRSLSAADLARFEPHRRAQDALLDTADDA